MPAFPLLVLCSLLPAMDPPAAKFPLGKDTTVITGPIDKDGYLDYGTALNERLGKGIGPQDNANVLIWQALGPTPRGLEQGMPAEYFELLGIAEPAKSGDTFVGLAVYYNRQFQGDHDGAYEDDRRRVSQRSWRTWDLPYLAAWLKLNEKPLRLVVEASQRSHYFDPLVSRRREGDPRGLIVSLMPSVDYCREMASPKLAPPGTRRRLPAQGRRR